MATNDWATMEQALANAPDTGHYELSINAGHAISLETRLDVLQVVMGAGHRADTLEILFPDGSRLTARKPE